MEPKTYDASVPIAVQAQESKRRKRRIMKIAVYFMFGIIAIGVFAIWLFHKDSVESLRFDSDFIFTVKLRSLEIKNTEGDTVLYGDMGQNLKATPYDHCWNDKFSDYEEKCLRWRNMAELRVTRDDNSTSSCYTMKWQGYKDAKEGVDAFDCFYLQAYQWYGYVNSTLPIWPVSIERHDNEPYYTSYPAGQTENLVPMWYGSQGVSIFVDSSHPFTTYWNASEKRQFCIRSLLKTDGTGGRKELLKYTVCQGESLEDIYPVTKKHLEEREADFFSGSDPNQPLPARPILSLTTKGDVSAVLSQPLFNHSECSFLEIHEDWENVFGDLEIDSAAVKDFINLTRQASAHGCFPILPISTFFSFNSTHFKEAVSRGFFVQDKLNLATHMMVWRGHEGAVLDVFNPLATEWFLGHMNHLISQYDIQAFKMLQISIPEDSYFYDSNSTYLDYSYRFAQDMASLNISLMQELATGFLPVPVQTPIHMLFSGEKGSACMATAIPKAFTMGMSGYPLLIATTNATSKNSMSEMRFKRWLQLAIFFPILRIPTIPLLRKPEIQEFVSKALALRQREFLPFLAQVQAEEPDNPLLRPLWWIAADDVQTLSINDQFLVGNRLLVAPLLCEDMPDQREVYLPEGKWRSDEIGLVQGPQTINFKINGFNSIPYFWRETEKGEQEGERNYLK